jgi:6-pyruvoyltetrahydropterin/6-carboxytetrahydropterin synthase
MPSRYQLKTHATFCAAHKLRGYQGNCARLHGHNYRVEVEVEATKLDEIGIGIDFRDIRAATEELAGELDHRYLNEIPPFDEVNPTAENVAAYFYRRLGRALDGPQARVAAVTIWETERCSVRYSEPSEE